MCVNHLCENVLPSTASTVFIQWGEHQYILSETDEFNFRFEQWLQNPAARFSEHILSRAF